MNFINKIPTTITRYVESIPFENEEEKIQIIESIAERISSIYAAFLTSDCHVNRNRSLSFFDFPKVFPPTEKVKEFKVNLKNTIVEKLKKRDEDRDNVYLSTNHAPEQLLATVLEKSDISEDYELYKLFPKKTSTKILSSNKFKKIEIWMTP
jgi:hypothetical protein